MDSDRVQTRHFEDRSFFESSRKFLFDLFTERFGGNGYNTYSTVNQHGESITFMSHSGEWRYSLRFKKRQA